MKKPFQFILSAQGGDTHKANNNSNKLAVPCVKQALDQMKYEIAQEVGVQLVADATSRANGSVGGEITKRLVQMAEQQLNNGRQQ